MRPLPIFRLFPELYSTRSTIYYLQLFSNNNKLTIVPSQVSSEAYHLVEW